MANWFKLASLPPRLQKDPRLFMREWKDMVMKTVKLTLPVATSEMGKQDGQVYYIAGSEYLDSLTGMSFSLSCNKKTYIAHLTCRPHYMGTTRSDPNSLFLPSNFQWTVNVYTPSITGKETDFDEINDTPEEVWDVGPYEAVQAVIRIIDGDQGGGDSDDVSPNSSPTPSRNLEPVLSSRGRR